MDCILLEFSSKICHPQSCRFEEEQGSPVMYIYEVQIEQAYQRQGLGKFMMNLAELMVSLFMSSLAITWYLLWSPATHPSCICLDWNISTIEHRGNMQKWSPWCWQFWRKTQQGCNCTKPWDIQSMKVLPVMSAPKALAGKQLCLLYGEELYCLDVWQYSGR